MSGVSYNDLSRTLIEKFPAIKMKFDEDPDWWTEELSRPYVVYGDLLCPYVMEIIDLPDRKQDLKEIFDFLEVLASEGDIRVQGVVALTVCETIVGNDKFAKVKEDMGPALRRFCEELEKPQ